MLSFSIGANAITVFLDGDITSVDNSHVNYAKLREELLKPTAEVAKEGEPVRNEQHIRDWLTMTNVLSKFSLGKVKVTGEKVMYGKKVITSHIAERMIGVLSEGGDLTPWAKFMENVMQNPSKTAQDELYSWLEKGKLPLTPDGCFLAFKKVRDNYMDCHTGKFDNSVGSVLEMDRSKCDPNRFNTCSVGFHFASVDYLSSFGGSRVMVVKINPRDVTAIPADYKITKGRCCRYEVIEELSSQSKARDVIFKKQVLDLENPQEFNDQQAEVFMKRQKPAAKKVATKKAPAKKPAAKKVATKKAPAKKPAAKSSTTDFILNKGKPGEVKFTAKKVKDALAKAPSIAAAAKDLGVGATTLSGWKRKLEK